MAKGKKFGWILIALGVLNLYFIYISAFKIMGYEPTIFNEVSITLLIIEIILLGLGVYLIKNKKSK